MFKKIVRTLIFEDIYIKSLKKNYKWKYCKKIHNKHSPKVASVTPIFSLPSIICVSLLLTMIHVIISHLTQFRNTTKGGKPYHSITIHMYELKWTLLLRYVHSTFILILFEYHFITHLSQHLDIDMYGHNIS
jgi:hypothetical protein